MADRAANPQFPKARLIQDAKPAGGWESIAEWNTRRRLPGRGPSGVALFAGVTAFCLWGIWRIAKSKARREADKQEAREARINLIPLLQAEEDRRYLRERTELLEEEALIMKDVPGWVVGESVYKTRWMPPAQKPTPM